MYLFCLAYLKHVLGGRGYMVMCLISNSTACQRPVIKPTCKPQLFQHGLVRTLWKTYCGLRNAAGTYLCVLTRVLSLHILVIMA